MLRCSDLLKLRVANVMSPQGDIYEKIEVGQEKTNEMVYPTFTKITRVALLAWIKASGKRRSDFLFTALKRPQGRALSDSAYRDLVKLWVEHIGLDPAKYSTHSLRRTKPVWMWKFGDPNTVTITVLKDLLGHQSVDSTTRYLGLDAMEAQEVALAHNMFAPGATRRRRISGQLSAEDLEAIAKVTIRQFEEELKSLNQGRQNQSLQPLSQSDIKAIAAETAKLLRQNES
jgi:integrase